MDAVFNQVFTPSSLSDLFVAWARFPDAIPYAGGTTLLLGQGQRLLRLPKNLISLSRIDELRKVSRTERFLDIGSMVSLGSVLGLGKAVPSALSSAILTIGNPQIRNMATLGGNLCYSKRCMGCFAVLSALDAVTELRTASGSRWVNINRLAPALGSPPLQNQELMIRVRIPLEMWSISLQARLESPRRAAASSSFCYLARCSKNIAEDIRLVFAGERLLRDRDLENSLVGKTLPLNRRERLFFLDRCRDKLFVDEYPPPELGKQLLEYIEQALTLSPY